MTNLGLNIIETDGRATPSIVAAPTSVAAFIIRAAEGVPGKVEQITNWRQFTTVFGNFTQDNLGTCFGAYAVRGFFENGGSKAYVTRIMPVKGDAPAMAAAPASIVLKSAGQEPKDALTLKAGYRGLEYPGKHGNNIEVIVRTNKENNETYDLIILSKAVEKETWEGLDNTGKYDANPQTKINDDLNGSRFIMVEKTETINPAPTTENGKEVSKSLTGGEDGAFTSGTLAAAAQNALENLFDTYDVQLVCCPETTKKEWVTKAITNCTGRGDCIFIGHTPFESDLQAAQTYGSDPALKDERGYGALYFPWILVADSSGNRIWIPPTGHILGIIARTEQERGIWKAPAGSAAQVRGALNVRYHITDTEHTNLVKDYHVNAIRAISGTGIIIDSSRTLGTQLWCYVNVRLLFNFVKSSLKQSLRWVVQEPNNETLWNKIKYNSVTPFLMGLWRRGAFGPGAPEDVFTVKVDDENNPGDQIKQGILNVEIYFYPSRPAETIIITVGQQEGGATATEA